MKTRILSGLAVALVALIILAFPVQSQTDQIIVTGADGRVDLGLAPSAQLNILTADLSPRFILQYADANKFYALPPLDPQLRILIGDIQDRMILQYADANKAIGLTYPSALFGDKTPPQASDSTVNSATGSITIIWTTDEFATSTVVYGVQPGVYTLTISDPLYVKDHRVTLIGLKPAAIQLAQVDSATTYYYQVRSTDRSGNIVSGTEGSFKATMQNTTYLPAVYR